MTDNETEPLVQYQTYYGSPAQRAIEGEADYVRLREAFYAGYRARPAEPIEPSRDALDNANRYLRHYGERFPRKPQPGFYPGRQPDYVQHGTVTGRIPPRPVVDAPYTENEVKLATSGILQEPVTGQFPRRDPDKARRMAEAYGAQPVAGPDPATLERVHDKLRRDGVVEYPSESTNPGFPAVTRSDTALMPPVVPDRLDDPGFEHTETVWRGEPVTTEPFDLHFGAPGPVPTPLSVQEDENG